MDLFAELLLLLEGRVQVLSEDETKRLISMLKKEYPLTITGNINWEKIKNKQLIILSEFINNYSLDEQLTIFWTYGSLPGIKILMSDFIKFIDYILFLGVDAYVFIDRIKCLIEFYHDGTITMGYSNETIKQ